MGTRHLIAVYLDGKHVVAQYGQWDGYPSGQGTTVLAFLRKLTPELLEQFKTRLRRCTWVTEKQLKRYWEEAGGSRDAQFVGMEVVEEFQKHHPQLDRDMGAGVLDFILGSTGAVELQDSIDFSGDSLFCEWAYIIDLDAGFFEVYEGFNKTPLEDGERFKAFDAPGEYRPVKHPATFDLRDLPTEEEFLRCLEN